MKVPSENASIYHLKDGEMIPFDEKEFNKQVEMAKEK